LRIKSSFYLKLFFKQQDHYFHHSLNDLILFNVAFFGNSSNDFDERQDTSQKKAINTLALKKQDHLELRLNLFEKVIRKLEYESILRAVWYLSGK
jgi:hypothetical protein